MRERIAVIEALLGRGAGGDKVEGILDPAERGTADIDQREVSGLSPSGWMYITTTDEDFDNQRWAPPSASGLMDLYISMPDTQRRKVLAAAVAIAMINPKEDAVPA